MANLIILNDENFERTTPAVHGEEITIKTPCDCSAVTGVQIAGVVYPFYDAAGKVMKMGTGLFATDNLIRVLIDTVNGRATIINPAITPPSIGAAQVVDMTVSVSNNWTTDRTNGGYYNTIAVSNILITDNPIVDVVLGSDVDANALYLDAWSEITRVVAGSGTLTLYANENKPTTAFTMQVKVVR